MKICFIHLFLPILLLTISISLSCGSYGKPTPPMSEQEYNEKLSTVYKAKNFDPQRTYESLSLHIDGKPISLIGENISLVKETFSMSWNHSGEYYDRLDIIKEYFSMDDKFSVRLHSTKNTNSLDGLFGMVYFSTAKRYGDIFDVGGTWTVNFDIENNELKKEATELFVTERFPILKGKLELKDGWEYTHESKSFTEHFEVSDGGHLSLRYDVKLK